MWGIDAAGWTAILFAIGWLVLLEGLLSADNALVLAVMVRHLPKDQQKRALRYGIWGAFAFRAVAVIFATVLLEFWWLKVGGGLYLIYLAVHHFATGGDDHGDEAAASKRRGRGLWGTVVNVELADVAFSIDSILAAVAMAETLPGGLEEKVIGPFKLTVGIWTVYIGGILGIIMMRIVAGFFLRLLDRFPGLIGGAYLLIGWIGIKLLESGLVMAFNPEGGIREGSWQEGLPAWLRDLPEIPEWLFWGVMVVIVVASLLIPRGKGQPHHHLAETPEGE